MKYLLAVSLAAAVHVTGTACGPYYPTEANQIRMFRCCTPELQSQWQEGCRFQDYEKEKNCQLWQASTSKNIDVRDIEKVVYGARLEELKKPGEGKLAGNGFAKWLKKGRHSEDLEYLLVAKEIEELRAEMNDPWYYGYEGDDEHRRLGELLAKCEAYKGKRHADRYALQRARIYFAQRDFGKCIELWENEVSGRPRNILTNMTASYAGGAYLRGGDREKAVELYTLSEDVGSLMSMKVWDDTARTSKYNDRRIKEMEFWFERFPNTPLLAIKMQDYVSACERTERDTAFFEELKHFAGTAAHTAGCHEKGMWHYALAYMHNMEGNTGAAERHLAQAEQSGGSPTIAGSVRALRMLLDAQKATDTPSYRSRLQKQLEWLDGMMAADIEKNQRDEWQYDNKMNWRFYYWQDVARRVILGEVCPRMQQAGNTTLALQLTNYATNRMHQLSPLYTAYRYDKETGEACTKQITFDEYRKSWPAENWFDYSNQFFESLTGSTADQAAAYARELTRPGNKLSRFLNERGYTDRDYIYEAVGTLYLREMRYAEAAEWLAKVPESYQRRTNLSKAGYFKLDPFKCQADGKQYVSDKSDYKLRFAQEMMRLESLMTSQTDPNRRATAKLRYATGLRNSFGRCWYLTQYGFSMNSDDDWESDGWRTYQSDHRKGFAGNSWAERAYQKVDRLMAEALGEFTDAEQAAQAQLELKNFGTVMKKYGQTRAAAYVRGHCDSYHDYALQKK